jgi:hypothetical protein
MIAVGKLLRDGRALGLAALVAVACSPAAAAAVPTPEQRFVDDHAAAVATLEAATTTDADTGATAQPTAEPQASQDVATVTEQAEPVEPAVVPADDAVLPPTVDDAATAATTTTQTSVVTDGVTTTTTTETDTKVIDVGAPVIDLAATSKLTVTATAATLTVDTAPHVTCAITVSGAGRVPGLDAKQSDPSGHIVWTWAVDATVSGAARVECTTNTQSVVVTPKVERIESDQPDVQTKSDDHRPATLPRLERDTERHGLAPRR